MLNRVSDTSFLVLDVTTIRVEDNTVTVFDKIVSRQKIVGELCLVTRDACVKLYGFSVGICTCQRRVEQPEGETV
jgi:hypothetical protein